MLYILGLFVVGVLGFILVYFMESGKITEKIEQKKQLQRFIREKVPRYNKSFVNEESLKAIVLDETDKKIHLFSGNKHHMYDFSGIIQSEVIVDNNIVTSTKRGKQIVGTAVGGLIAGIPGMIIAGLSTGQSTSEKIKTIELKLTLNDMNNSIFKISFFSSIFKDGDSKDSSKVKNAIIEIDKWNGIFNIILKQQNQVI